jgi:hypothetical protein
MCAGAGTNHGYGRPPVSSHARCPQIASVSTSARPLAAPWQLTSVLVSRQLSLRHLTLLCVWFTPMLAMDVNASGVP